MTEQASAPTFQELLAERMRSKVFGECIALTDLLAQSFGRAQYDGTEVPLKDFVEINTNTLREACLAVAEDYLRQYPDTADVPKGDELDKLVTTTIPRAIVMHKRRSGEVTAMTNKDHVVRTVEEEATKLRKSNPRLTPAQARTAVWLERTDLSQKYAELPEGPDDTQPGTNGATKDTTTKGASVIERATVRAKEIQKKNPTMSLAAARSQVWETDPILRAEFEQQMRS